MFEWLLLAQSRHAEKRNQCRYRCEAGMDYTRANARPLFLSPGPAERVRGADLEKK